MRSHLVSSATGDINRPDLRWRISLWSNDRCHAVYRSAWRMGVCNLVGRSYEELSLRISKSPEKNFEKPAE